MRQEGSQSFKISRSDASSGDLDNSSTLLSRDYAEFRPPGEEKEPVWRSLSREITEHKLHREAQSYLDRAVSFLGDPFSGSSESLENLKALEAEARKGEPSQERQKEMLQAIAYDRAALKVDSEITKYGSGMVQTAGLFLSKKKGLALSVGSFAAASAKPDDSAGTQALDLTMGAAKGAVTRGIFGTIGAAKIDIPSKALLMGSSSRLTDSVLSRKTYLDPENGTFNLSGAAGRIIHDTLRPEAVASDVLVFGAGQVAMSSSVVKRFAEKSALSATMASASAFGFAGGSAEEATRQLESGKFDLTAIVGRGIARGATDAIASIPGGLQGNRLAAQRKAQEFDILTKTDGNPEAIAFGGDRSAVARNNHAVERSASSQNTGDYGVSARNINIGAGRIEVVNPTIPGSKSREFQLVGGDVPALEKLRGSKAAAAVVAVREMSPSGAVVGPTKQMLVQHVDAATPLNSRLAATVDLIATCNPQTLCGAARSKHIFPDLIGSLQLSRLSDRLVFGPSDFSAATAGGAIKLGQLTVSDILRQPNTENILRTPRPLELYAREMKHFKDPAKRVIDGGADSIVFELADGRILKMTDRPYRKDGVPLWYPDWGHRTITTEGGVPYRFDARLLSDPKQIEVNHEPIVYYIQERARTPVSTESLLKFHNLIDRDGNYVFWDGGVSSLGQAQLGYVKGPDGQRRLVLLDYDAVRKPGDVPNDARSSGSSSDHWMNRYRADRIDWDALYK